MFHCVEMPQFVYPPILQWPLGLLPPLGSRDQRCRAHGGGRLFRKGVISDTIAALGSVDLPRNPIRLLLKGLTTLYSPKNLYPLLSAVLDLFLPGAPIPLNVSTFVYFRPSRITIFFSIFPSTCKLLTTLSLFHHGALLLNFTQHYPF